MGSTGRVAKPESGRRRPETSAQRERTPPAPAGPQRQNSELIIGRRPILEAFRSGRTLHRIMIAEGAHGTAPSEIVRLAATRNVLVKTVPKERLDALSDHHQGVVADAAPYEYGDFGALLQSVREAPADQPPLILAVDAVQDPQNFGSLLRSTLAVGGTGVILPERRSVGVTPAVGRSSAGAIEHLNIVHVVNLARALNEIKQAGLWVVGLDAEASKDYDEVDLTVPLVVVVGSEGSGLGRLVAQTCDMRVRLPMIGPIDSLNAAVAGSVVLYEALRQRLSKGMVKAPGQSPPSG